MTSFVMDASVTMAWCFRDEGNEETEAVLRNLVSHSAVVPQLWVYEVSNVLSVGIQRKRVKVSEAKRFLSLLQQLPIEIDRFLPNSTELVRLSGELKLSSYDAAYLELSMRRGLFLSTQDSSLREAARHLGIGLYRGS